MATPKPIQMNVETTTTTQVKITLTGAQILELLENKVAGGVPNTAKIQFCVPGGGDYSNTKIEFKHAPFVVIEYESTTSS